MKKFSSVLMVAVFLARACFGQSITSVSPSDADVGQGLEVSIASSNNSMFFCPQILSWRVCDTVKRVYFQKGDSIREAYKFSIPNYYDNTIIASMGFPLSSPAGAWDVVIEHKPTDTTIHTIQKIVSAGAFTLNPLSSPVVDSIRPVVVYQNRKVVFDIFGTHTHFKFAQLGSLLNNVAAVSLSRGSSSIQADSFSIQNCTQVQAYFTLKNKADTGLFTIKIDQGGGLLSAVLQNAVSIKTAPSSSYSLPDGCIAFYPFEGDAADRSYSGNDGVLSNTVTVDGIFGQGLYFNGRNSSVVIPNSPSLTATNGFSICAWVKPEFDSAGTTQYGIIEKGYSNWHLGIDLYSGVYFYLSKNGTYYASSLYANNMHTNEWNHIMGTWDGAVMRTYINGVLQPDTMKLLAPLDNTPDNMIIGANSDGTFFKGIIDEVMVFNRGLRAAEVDSIYQGMYLGNSQSNSTVPLIVPYKPKVTLDPRPKFAWHSTAGMTSYTLSAATNASFSTIIFQIPLSDTTFTPSVNLPIGPVYWHVQSNLSQRWSLADNFFIQTDTIPFIHRFDGASVNSRRPTFAWNKVPKAGTYRIEIASNSLYINPYLTTLVNDTAYSPLGDLRSGVSYWHVSSDRNIAFFCQPDSLVIQAKTPASSPHALLPSTYSCAVKKLFKTGPLMSYSLPIASAVSIKLYSLQGKLVKELSRSYKQAGYYESYLGISNFSRGYYIVDFKAGAFNFTKRISNF